MEHVDFKIGMEFWCSGRHWRCTDIGTRTVIAIRVDRITICSIERRSADITKRELTKAEAEAEGWFNGPSYPLDEIVFDEDDFEACTLKPDEDEAPVDQSI